MKTFFDGVYIEESDDEDGAEYPMKLEYYTTIETKKFVRAKYGVEVVKTELIDGKVEVEKETLEHITGNVNKINKILNILKDNKVTPVCLTEVINDML